MGAFGWGQDRLYRKGKGSEHDWLVLGEISDERNDFECAEWRASVQLIAEYQATGAPGTVWLDAVKAEYGDAVSGGGRVDHTRGKRFERARENVSGGAGD